MESTFSTTLLITNRLHVSLTDGHAEIQTGHTLGFIPETIHNGTTVKMRVVSRDGKSLKKAIFYKVLTITSKAWIIRKSGI